MMGKKKLKKPKQYQYQDQQDLWTYDEVKKFYRNSQRFKLYALNMEYYLQEIGIMKTKSNLRDSIDLFCQKYNVPEMVREQMHTMRRNRNLDSHDVIKDFTKKDVLSIDYYDLNQVEGYRKYYLKKGQKKLPSFLSRLRSHIEIIKVGGGGNGINDQKQEETKIEACYYGENCRNKNCKLDHPMGKNDFSQPCKFGDTCYKYPNCLFIHLNKPNIGELIDRNLEKSMKEIQENRKIEKQYPQIMCPFQSQCPFQFQHCDYDHPVPQPNSYQIQNSSDFIQQHIQNQSNVIINQQKQKEDSDSDQEQDDSYQTVSDDGDGDKNSEIENNSVANSEQQLKKQNQQQVQQTFINQKNNGKNENDQKSDKDGFVVFQPFKQKQLQKGNFQQVENQQTNKLNLDENKIIVKQIDKNLNEDEIKEIFEQKIGIVKFIKLLKDELNRSKGTAFIQFENKQDFQKALLLKNIYIYQKQAIIKAVIDSQK